MTQPRVPRRRRPADPGESRRLPLPQGGRVIQGDPSQQLDGVWRQAVRWSVLLAGAGVDVATFYQVILLVMNIDVALEWVVVVGFTAIALTLAHIVGVQARDATSTRATPGADVAAWVCFGIWLALGTIAFVVRWLIQPADEAAAAGSSWSTPDDPSAASGVGDGTPVTTFHLAALMFLVLYLATGAVSAATGYFRPNPAARKWKRAERKRTKASERVAEIEAQLAIARTLQESVRRAVARSQPQPGEIETQCVAAATRLQQEARLEMQRKRTPVFVPAERDDQVEGAS